MAWAALDKAVRVALAVMEEIVAHRNPVLLVTVEKVETVVTVQEELGVLAAQVDMDKADLVVTAETVETEARVMRVQVEMVGMVGANWVEAVQGGQAGPLEMQPLALEAVKDRREMGILGRVMMV
ncbi:MAG: hypothetical protein IPK83_05205 [Planctomycetes bacterium]|nr:hypothetical protein [Planctomycetota bacterium]